MLKLCPPVDVDIRTGPGNWIETEAGERDPATDQEEQKEEAIERRREGMGVCGQA